MPEAESEPPKPAASPCGLRWFVWAVLALLAFNVILFGKFVLAYFSK